MIQIVMMMAMAMKADFGYGVALHVVIARR
jgi:hypothetical protein